MESVDSLETLNELAGFVSTGRAAAMLDVSRVMVNKLVSAGTLRAKRWDGRTLMIERASVEAYLADHPPEQRRHVAGGRPRRTK